MTAASTCSSLSSPQLLFETQAARTPHATAVFDDRHGALTYADVNRRANRLAHALQRRSATGDRIAVCVRRSPNLVTALLGVLKAGSTTVPIDPTLPADRIRAILADSDPDAVLVDQVDDLPDRWSDRAVVVDEIVSDARVGALPNPACAMTEDDIWTIVYTSGTTGTPKGVMVPIGAVMRHMQWMWSTYPFVATDVALLHRSCMLISSTWDYFGPLLRGVPSVILAENWTVNRAAAWRAINRYEVSLVAGSPAMWQVLLNLAEQCPATWRSLRLGMISGEQVSVGIVRRWHRAFPAARLLNVYGSSECVRPTVYDTLGLHPHAERVPVGRPLPGVAIQILDEQQQPASPGTHGEVSITGACVAAGYLNLPGLTSERFGRTTDPSVRTYRTGDIGYIDHDGNLVITGRRDRQVKIRGFRVELEEVEAALLRCDGVRQAAVVPIHDAETGTYLVAHLVGERDRLSTAALRTGLAAIVPDYMIPAKFIAIDAMPLTSSGKVDWRALSQTAAAPTRADSLSPTEAGVMAVWAEVFKLADVDRHADFFDAGGHSLTAMLLLSRLRETFGVDLSLGALFGAPTIRELAAIIEQRTRAGERGAEQVAV